MRDTYPDEAPCHLCLTPTNELDSVGIPLCCDVCELVWNEMVGEFLTASYDPALDPTYVTPGDPF